MPTGKIGSFILKEESEWKVEQKWEFEIKVEIKTIICGTKIQIFVIPVRIDSAMDRFHQSQMERKVSDCLQYIIFISFFLFSRFYFCLCILP